jgi:hypothetical protein
VGIASSSGRSRAAIGHALGLLALLFVLALTWVESTPVRATLPRADAIRAQIESDDALYRLPHYVGLEWPIVTHLREHHPPGTAVSLPWDPRFARRTLLGFQFVLLPDYPVRADARLAIIHRRRLQEGDRIVADGSGFVLVERPGATP